MRHHPQSSNSSLNITRSHGSTIKNKERNFGGIMKNTRELNPDLEAIAWGAFFILWGITEMFKSLPDGTGAVGIGLILLGLNAVRHFKGIATSGFTTTLGVLALVGGGLELAGAALSLPFELPVFAILLILLGVIILANEFKASHNQRIDGMK
jgi:hypothetical protein